MTRHRYETAAGYVSRAETYSQLIEYLIRAQEAAAVLGHLHNLQDNRRDKILGSGWLTISEALKLMQNQVTQLATGRLKQ